MKKIIFLLVVATTIPAFAKDVVFGSKTDPSIAIELFPASSSKFLIQSVGPSAAFLEVTVPNNGCGVVPMTISPFPNVKVLPFAEAITAVDIIRETKQASAEMVTKRSLILNNDTSEMHCHILREDNVTGTVGPFHAQGTLATKSSATKGSACIALIEQFNK